VIVGSGATQGNIKELFLHADGIIVGTALKQGKSVSKEEQVNLKSSDQRIDQTLVQSFMQAARG
jgi:predicted TIM-barrel enzyme